MSNEDYKAGEKGLPWSPMMDRGDYESGKSVRDAKEAILRTGTGQSTAAPGSGAGIGLLLLLPLSVSLSGGGSGGRRMGVRLLQAHERAFVQRVLGLDPGICRAHCRPCLHEALGGQGRRALSLLPLLARGHPVCSSHRLLGPPFLGRWPYRAQSGPEPRCVSRRCLFSDLHLPAPRSLGTRGNGNVTARGGTQEYLRVDRDCRVAARSND